MQAQGLLFPYEKIIGNKITESGAGADSKCFHR